MDLRELLNLDQKHAHGQLSEPKSAAEAIYQSLAVDPNARQTEFLATTNPDLLLPAIRSALLRGDFERAEKKLAELAREQDEVAQTECLVDRARLAAFRGLWSQCREICEESLHRKSDPVTQLSVLQIRSVALMEMGRLTEALNDVEMVLSQAESYPRAVAIGFCKAQRIRILMRERGPRAVAPDIADLWLETISTEPLNLDLVLVLLRLEIDRCRLLGLPYTPFAQACCRVADVLGDRLYEGLAILDLVAGVEKPGDTLIRILTGYIEEFSRMRRLYEDASSETSVTVSGQALRMSKREVLELDELPRQSLILLREPACVIDLREHKAKCISGNQEWLALANELASAGVEKSVFFQKMWNQKYSPELHDGVLRTFLSRLKSKSGLVLKNERGLLSLPDVLVL